MCGKMGQVADKETRSPIPIRGKVILIDSCIADIVASLVAGGLFTVASCCGHKKLLGNIILDDGRVLEIYPNQKVWEEHRKKHSAILDMQK